MTLANDKRRPRRHWWPPRLRYGASAYVAVAFLGAVLLLLIAYPIGLLLYGSISKTPPQALVFSFDNITLQGFATIVTSETMHGAMANTLLVSFGGAAIALVISLIFVWAVGRTNVPLKAFIGIAAITPLFVSELVVGIAWSKLGYSYSGLINIALRDLNLPFVVNFSSIPGIALVLGLYYAPYVYLLMIAAFRNLDPSLEEVAATCGAGTLYTVRRVVLPLMSYAIVSAAIMVFVHLLSSYGIPYVLGSSITRMDFMTTYLYSLLHRAPTDYQLASTIGVLLTSVTLAAVLIQARLFASRSHATIVGRAYQPRVLDIGRWRYVLLAFVFAYIIIAVVLPYIVLVSMAFRQTQFFMHFVDWLNPSTLTIANFTRVLANPLMVRSIGNTLTVGVLVAVIGLVLCFILGYVIERTRLPGRAFLQTVSSIPVAIPSIIVGVAFLWAWIMLPVGLYGTIWILVFAFVARHVPDGLRPVSATLRQIHEELEEAAYVCGASWGRTAVRILAPLARGGVLSLVILLFIYAVRELGPVLFLTNQQTQVMAVQVLASWEQGDVAGATVVALLQSSILIGALVIARFVFKVRVTP